MIWDFEDLFFLAVIGSASLLVLWLILRRAALGWGRSKVAGFYLAMYCFGAFLLILFEVVASTLGPAEIQGLVSQVDLRFPAGRKGDHSHFEVTSSSGVRVKLASEHHVAEHLSFGEGIYVRYNPLTSEPDKIERLDGSNRQVLFDSRDYPIFRAFLRIDYGMLLVTAVGVIYGIRKFSLAS